MKYVLAADSEIDPATRRCESGWSPPAFNELRVSPGFPDRFYRSVKHPSNHDISFLDQPHSAGSGFFGVYCTHEVQVRLSCKRVSCNKKNNSHKYNPSHPRSVYEFHTFISFRKI